MKQQGPEVFRAILLALAHNALRYPRTPSVNWRLHQSPEDRRAATDAAECKRERKNARRLRDWTGARA